MRLWFCIFTWQDLRRFFSKFQFLRFFLNFCRRIFWDCFSQNWSPFVITIKLCNFCLFFKFSKLFKNSGSFFIYWWDFHKFFLQCHEAEIFQRWSKVLLFFQIRQFSHIYNFHTASGYLRIYIHYQLLTKFLNSKDSFLTVSLSISQ